MPSPVVPYVPGAPMPANVPIFPGANLPRVPNLPAPALVYKEPVITGFVKPPENFGFPEAAQLYDASIAELMFNREFGSPTHHNEWRSVTKDLKTKSDTNSFIRAVYNASVNPVKPYHGLVTSPDGVASFGILNGYSEDPDVRLLEEVKRLYDRDRKNAKADIKAMSFDNRVRKGDDVTDEIGLDSEKEKDAYGLAFLPHYKKLNNHRFIGHDDFIDLRAHGWPYEAAKAAYDHDINALYHEAFKFYNIAKQNFGNAPYYSPGRYANITRSEPTEYELRLAREDAAAKAAEQAELERSNFLRNATPEERKAFYAKEAAEREAAERARVAEKIRSDEMQNGSFTPMDVRNTLRSEENSKESEYSDLGTMVLSLVHDLNPSSNTDPILDTIYELYTQSRDEDDPNSWQGLINLGLNFDAYANARDDGKQILDYVKQHGDPNFTIDFADSETFARDSHDETTLDSLMQAQASALAEEDDYNGAGRSDASVQHKIQKSPYSSEQVSQNVADMSQLNGGGFLLDKAKKDLGEDEIHFKIQPSANKAANQYTFSTSRLLESFKPLVFLEDYNHLLRKLSDAYSFDAAANIISNDDFVKRVSSEFLNAVQTFFLPSYFFSPGRRIDLATSLALDQPSNLLEFFVKSLSFLDFSNSLPAEFIKSALVASGQPAESLDKETLSALARAALSFDPISWFPALKNYIDSPEIFHAIAGPDADYDPEGIAQAFNEIILTLVDWDSDLNQYSLGLLDPLTHYVVEKPAVAKGDTRTSPNGQPAGLGNTYHYSKEDLNAIRKVLAQNKTLDRVREKTATYKPRVPDVKETYDLGAAVDNAYAHVNLKPPAVPPEPKEETAKTKELPSDSELRARILESQRRSDFAEKLTSMKRPGGILSKNALIGGFGSDEPLGDFIDYKNLQLSALVKEDIQFEVGRIVDEICARHDLSYGANIFIQILLQLPLFDNSPSGGLDNALYILRCFQDPRFIANSLVSVNAARNGLTRGEGRSLQPTDADIALATTAYPGWFQDAAEKLNAANNVLNKEYPSLFRAAVDAPAILFNNAKIGAQGQVGAGSYYGVDPIATLAAVAKSHNHLKPAYNAINLFAGQGGRSLDLADQASAARFIKDIAPLIEHYLNSYNSRYAHDANRQDPALDDLRSFVFRYGKSNKLPFLAPSYLSGLNELAGVTPEMLLDTPEAHAALHQARYDWLSSFFQTLAALTAKKNLNFDPNK